MKAEGRNTSNLKSYRTIPILITRQIRLHTVPISLNYTIYSVKIFKRITQEQEIGVYPKKIEEANWFLINAENTIILDNKLKDLQVKYTVLSLHPQPWSPMKKNIDWVWVDKITVLKLRQRMVKA